MADSPDHHINISEIAVPVARECIFRIAQNTVVSTSLDINFSPVSLPFMAEKDATARLRRAVKGQCILLPCKCRCSLGHATENNLFLVKRLIQRTDMRNPDTAPQRYTSLAWAAVLGHDETFEFLLSAGHDDDELSRVC